MEQFLHADVRLAAAVEIELATGPGPIGERLANAWRHLWPTESLGLLPAHLATELALSTEAIQEQGVDAWVESLTTEQCRFEAQRLVHWLHAVRQAPVHLGGLEERAA
ncbi:MAG TPA: hypothetical protein PKA49_08565 [Tepidiformaceae bacterium]|jgi:hypothetical protein|nr:hypothetical protein [Thermoflexaceae bacterium]HMS58893.1 hypothetical protein [Tepidiformaceae bacterium]